MKTIPPIYPLGREDREAQKLLDRIKMLQAKGTAPQTTAPKQCPSAA
jgi:hypothetical protein